MVSDAADEMQIDVFVVGGFVRDLIMERPSVDIDIVAIGNGVDLAQKVAQKVGEHVKVSIFKNFGTAMFKYPYLGKMWDIEFVGARKESYQKDSRKPTVETGSLQDDQNRRDFTINALAISLNRKTLGSLVDSFGGVQDIENKIIRTPLDADITFSDDPLRMMRAIRFATQLDFRIEDETFEAIARNTERIKIISEERIIDELHKMILSPKPSLGFKLLEKCGLLPKIFPELSALKGAEYVGGKGHKDNFYHTLEVVDNISQKTDNLWLRWAALLHDIAKPQTKRYVEGIGWTFHGHEIQGAKMIKTIFRKMKLPLNEKMKYVEKLVALHLRPIILAEDIVTDSAVRRLLFDAGDDIDDLMMLCSADVTSKNPEKIKRFLHNFEVVKQKLKEIEEKDRIRNFQPPVTGEDIMEYFQIPPSPPIGIIKTAIKDAIMDGIIENDRQQAFELMLKEAEKLGLRKPDC